MPYNLNKHSLKLYLPLVLAFVVSACHSNNNGPAFTISKAVIYPDSTKNLDKVIQGRWSNLRDTALMFEIDSNHHIFYQEANAAYPFKLKRDSMTITFDDDIYHARLKMLSKDSLVMIGTGKDKGNIDSVYRNDLDQ